MIAATPNDKQAYLSLKWKAVIALSLVILVINAAFYYYHYHHLHKQNTLDRAHIAQKNLQLLQSQAADQAHSIEQLGTILPSLYNIQESLHKNRWQEIHNTLNNHGSNLQAEYSIDSIGIHNRQGEVLAFWGTAADRESFNVHRLGLSDFFGADTPHSAILCLELCKQTSLIPFLSDTSEAAFISITTSIADLVIRFNRSTHVDIGILNANETQNENSLRFGNEYFQISALSNSADTLPAISKWAGFKTDNGTQIIPYNDKVYELTVAPLSLLSHLTDGKLVLINDISAQTRQLAAISQNSLYIAILGWLFSELTLLLVLWKPLSRLNRTTSVLPLLAQGDFQQAQNIFREQKESSGISPDDEIDLLHDSAVKLTEQLQALQIEVDSKTSFLASNMTTLQQERDFIKKLFDVAQVLILTHNDKDELLQVNNLACVISNKKNEELIGRSFVDTFLSPDQHKSYRSQLRKLLHHELQYFKLESTIEYDNTEAKTIAWLHSLIVNPINQQKNILSIGLDITERKNAEIKIAWLANHDPLTGLYNRRYFNEVFDGILRYSQRSNRQGVLLFLDMDNFKYINDTQGHNAGDRLIREIANALKTITRDSDVIARLGGDEFAIIMRDAAVEGAIQFCTELNRRINSVIRPITRGGIQTTASIGIAVFPNHGNTVNELLANADMAMYQAKEKGKSGWHVFSEHDQAREKLRDQVNWKKKIEESLNLDSFLLYYQPIMNISNGITSHYEVLLRMRDSNGQILAPKPFIEVAEHTGLIHSIDQMVLHKTIQLIHSLGNRARNIKFSLNLSAHTFSDKDSLPNIKKLIQKYNVPSSSLMFEITETAALSDIGAACNMIDGLRKLGCHFAIDDFGVGFSSFYYLRELPVDYIKIDGSFIQQLARNTDDQLVVRAMSEIVRGFGKKTIAEYVEDSETLSLLKQFNVDYAQGFFIGPPNTQTAFEREIA